MRTFLLVAAVALLVIGCSSKSVDKGRRDRKEKKVWSKLAHAKQARQNSYGYDDSSYQDQNSYGYDDSSYQDQNSYGYDDSSYQDQNSYGYDDSSYQDQNSYGYDDSFYQYQYSSPGSWNYNYNYYFDEFVYETCQGTEGIITSPGYPDNMLYRNNYHCNRTVEIPEGKVVVFTIENMDVELANQCMFDRVMISDSANSDDPTVLCGYADYCKSIVARGDKAEVSFDTDYSVTGLGFSITYTIEDDSQQESNCERPKPTCAPSDFQCDDACIPPAWVCDNFPDCIDGSDEPEDCPEPTCAPSDYICSDGQCIPWYWECDGIVDCSDAGDEAGDCPQGSYVYNGPAYSSYETYGSY